MSKIKHRLLPRADECGPRIVDEKGRQIAEVWGTHEEALVLTAAFELRDTCLGILECLEHGDKLTGVSRRHCLQTLQAVLAKTRPTE